MSRDGIRRPTDRSRGRDMPVEVSRASDRTRQRRKWSAQRFYDAAPDNVCLRRPQSPSVYEVTRTSTDIP
jgi:hypothetical protein